MDEAPRTRKRSLHGRGVGSGVIGGGVGSGVGETEELVGGVGARAAVEARSREWKPWSEAESARFYDALRTHGKDFDAVRKHIAAKAGGKTYDQIRNHYYNTLNKISVHAPAVLADATNASKEARELFLLINYGEWRRRGLGGLAKPGGPLAERFKELVLKGATTVRLSGGKGHGGKASRAIRTPNCPSLRKFTEKSQVVAALPPLITLLLVPRTYGDKDWVLHCEQNPLVRLTPGPTQPIAPILLLLRRKWIPASLRIKETQLGQDITHQLPTIKLFPSQSLSLNSTILRPAPAGSAGPSTGISWEKCQHAAVFAAVSSSAATAQPPSAKVAKVAQKERPIEDSAGDSNDSSEASTTQPVETEESSSSELRLSAERLVAGLGLESVSNMTVGELCMMCNLSPTIRLCYSIQSPLKPPDDQPTESWKALMTLLRREYADILSRPSATNDAVQAPSRGRKEIPVSARLVQKESIIPPAAPEPPPADLSGCTSVDDENRAFAAQLSQLNSRQPVVRRHMLPPPPASRPLPDLGAPPAPTKVITVHPTPTPEGQPTTSLEEQAVAGLMEMGSDGAMAAAKKTVVQVEERSIQGLISIRDQPLPDQKTPPKAKTVVGRKSGPRTDFSLGLSPGVSRENSASLITNSSPGHSRGGSSQLSFSDLHGPDFHDALNAGSIQLHDLCHDLRHMVSRDASSSLSRLPPHPASTTLHTPHKEAQ